LSAFVRQGALFVPFSIERVTKSRLQGDNKVSQQTADCSVNAFRSCAQPLNFCARSK
jgi:hypothetical protein